MLHANAFPISELHYQFPYARPLPRPAFELNLSRPLFYQTHALASLTNFITHLGRASISLPSHSVASHPTRLDVATMLPSGESASSSASAAQEHDHFDPYEECHVCFWKVKFGARFVCGHRVHIDRAVVYINYGGANAFARIYAVGAFPRNSCKTSFVVSGHSFPPLRLYRVS